MIIVWNEKKTVGIVLNLENNTDNEAMAYELRKGALNSLGILHSDIVEGWAEFTADDNCTIETVRTDEGVLTAAGWQRARLGDAEIWTRNSERILRQGDHWHIFNRDGMMIYACERGQIPEWIR